MSARIARITIYPMKSCDGRTCDATEVMPSGALLHDRQFALIDSSGRLINAKRTPLMHRMRLEIDPVHRSYRISQRDGGGVLSGSLDDDGKQLSDWLTDFFSLQTSIVENDSTGFPDDTVSVGPTVVSTATLQTVSGWFNDLPLDEVRNRFRANIEIDGVEPFWEDRLYHADLHLQPFRLGDVVFGGSNPCQRCVVPSRNSQTGDVTPRAFAVAFAKHREASLPEWAPRERFDHFYRLTTNTQLVDLGTGTIRIGDPVEIVGG